MLGNERQSLGWFRDARCEPPNWPLRRLAKQTVKLKCPAGRWMLEVVDPVSGMTHGPRVISSGADGVTVELPEFEDAIAFKLTAGTP